MNLVNKSNKDNIYIQRKEGEFLNNKIINQAEMENELKDKLIYYKSKLETGIFKSRRPHSQTKYRNRKHPY